MKERNLLHSALLSVIDTSIFGTEFVSGIYSSLA